jgi:hypothetical protein
MRSYSVFARVVLNSSRSRICSSIQPPNRPCPSFQRRLAEPGGSPVVESYKALRHMSSSNSSPGPSQDTQQEPVPADLDPDMIALRYVRNFPLCSARRDLTRCVPSDRISARSRSLPCHK